MKTKVIILCAGVLAFLVYVNWMFSHAPNRQPTIIGVKVNGYTIFYHKWDYKGE